MVPYSTGPNSPIDRQTRASWITSDYSLQVVKINFIFSFTSWRCSNINTKDADVGLIKETKMHIEAGTLEHGSSKVSFASL